VSARLPRPGAATRLVGGALARWPGLGAALSALESRAVADALPDRPIRAPVYIAGLARAGSTVLLEVLHGTGAFASQRYADYPMLWTPYWWNRLRQRLPRPRAAPSQRAHGDRIEVTVDSPEAFEEPLWMHFFPGRHDPGIDQVLEPGAGDGRFAPFYRAHIGKLLAVHGRDRYLAKGNYNLARLPLLQALFPDARFIVPLREPVAQVASLIKQDRLFCAAAAADRAIDDHLRRTGHFEFGPGKRAENLGDGDAAAAIAAAFANGEVLDGYARQWQLSYGWLAGRLDRDPGLAAAIHLVDYDALCRSPGPGLAALARHAGIPAHDLPPLLQRWLPRISAPAYYRPDLRPAEVDRVHAHCAATHARLLERIRAADGDRR
jgi:hypothetical protein